MIINDTNNNTEIERFKRLVDISSDWVWETDDKGVFTYSSGGAERILGYSTGELVGKNYKNFLRKSELNENHDGFTKELHTHIKKDGTDCIMESVKIAKLNENGLVVGYMGVDHDITEKVTTLKKLEEQFSEIEKRNKFLIDRELKMIELKKENEELKKKLENK